MTRFTEPAEDLSRKAKEYIDLRLDDVKLRTASYAWSAFGVSVLLALGLWILIRRRDHLFKDTFVPLFINLFFNDDDDEQEE